MGCEDSYQFKHGDQWKAVVWSSKTHTHTHTEKFNDQWVLAMSRCCFTSVLTSQINPFTLKISIYRTESKKKPPNVFTSVTSQNNRLRSAASIPGQSTQHSKHLPINPYHELTEMTTWLPHWPNAIGELTHCWIRSGVRPHALIVSSELVTHVLARAVRPQWLWWPGGRLLLAAGWWIL